MKMKMLLAALFLCSLGSLNAQTFSNWITDSKHPTLKVRYRTQKDANGYSFLALQLHSDVQCKLSVTASLCDKDQHEKNGWKNISLLRDQTLQYSYKILNSCTNGFWWWYKNYQAGVKYDDN